MVRYRLWSLLAVLFLVSGLATIVPPFVGPPGAVGAILTLGDALDKPDLGWTTGGNGNWSSQTAVSYFGGSSAQSGPIGNGQTSWLKTPITGPGTLKFWWKVSSEAPYDYLEFTLDSGAAIRISGDVDWQQKSYSILTGTHQLEWKYVKDSSVSAGTDRGWVDRVEYVSAATAPTISCSPSRFAFNSTQGGPNPLGQTLTIRNIGGGALDWSVAAGASWLVLTPSSGRSTGQACTTTVVVNTAGLTAGTYSASITISAPGAANSPMTAPVTLAVVSTTTPPAPAPPTIGYSPANVVFAATQGGSNPSAQSLGVWNSGGGTLNWSVSDDAPWLALSPASGSSTGETDPVSVSVNITGLAAGTYTAMVSIWASGATNSPRYMGVVLTVAASTAPSLGQAVDNLALAWATGGHGNWLGQRGTSFYGGSAAQSGRIGNNQSTWMKTTVTGPGTVSFYWSVSSENRCDFLRFLVDGTERDFISGSLSWRQCSYGIASGTHVLEWRYTKDLSVSISGDCGWVDKVQFAPNTSTILERRVTGSTDDGYVTLKGGVPAGFSSMETLVFAGQRLGASYDTFLRFTDIRVPKGATIRKAYMMLYLNNLDIPPWLNVYVEDSPNPSNVGSPGDYLGRAVSGGGDYFFSPGSKGWKQTPDISPLIQGLVNKWDYSGGAAMQVFLKNVGDSSTFISFFSAYEHLVDHSDAAVLHIEFDPPR